MRFYFLLCLCFLGVLSLNAQGSISRIENLQTLVDRLPDNTIKVDSLNELSWLLGNVNPYLARSYAEEALELSQNLAYLQGEGTALNRLGVTYYTEGLDFDSALYYLTRSLKLREQLGDTSSIIGVKNNIALVYKEQGNVDTALLLYAEVSSIALSVNNMEKVARSKMNIGNLYLRMGNLVTSLKYFFEAKDLLSNLGESWQAVRVNLNIANVYERMGRFSNALALQKEYLLACKTRNYKAGISKAYNNIGNNYFQLSRFDSAVYYYGESIRLKEEIGDNKGLASSFKNLASAMLRIGNDRDSAVSLLSKSLDIRVQEGNTSGLASTYWGIGNAFHALGDSVIAVTMYLQALKNAQISGVSIVELEVLKSMSELYASFGDDAASFEYYQKYYDLKDSLNAQISSAYQLELDYNESQYELELARLTVQKKSLLMTLLATSLVLLTIIFFALLRVEKQKRKALKAETVSLERKNKIERLLKDQELSSINKVLEAQDSERKRIAQELHDRLGSTLAMVKLYFKNVEDNIKELQEKNTLEYNKATKLLDEACEEVRVISHSLMSGSLKNFGLIVALEELKSTLESSGSIKVELITYGLEKRLDSNFEVNVYRIIQELVTNVLRHAQATELGIQLVRSDGKLNIIVEDNGIGFDQNRDYLERGIGLKNIQARLDMINGELEIDSSAEKGTTIILNILLKDQDDKNNIS